MKPSLNGAMNHCLFQSLLVEMVVEAIFFAPLRDLFGPDYVHGCPAREQFSLIDLEKAKVCLLDEWGLAREALHLPLQFPMWAIRR